MKRLVMVPFGLVAVGLFALWTLARDLRLWWAWRKEDRRGGCGRAEKSGCRRRSGLAGLGVTGAAES